MGSVFLKKKYLRIFYIQKIHIQLIKSDSKDIYNVKKKIFISKLSIMYHISHKNIKHHNCSKHL